MADAPPNAVFAGSPEPHRVERGAAAPAATTRTKHSAASSPSLAHDERDDDESVASSTGTERRRVRGKAKGKAKATPAASTTAQPQAQQQYQQQPLRKSASVSTTASAQTNTSTEARAAVSHRASRSALNRKSPSSNSSPAISYTTWHELDSADPSSSSSSTYWQGTGLSYPHYHQHHDKTPEAEPSHFPTSVSLASENTPTESSGIVQVNPAPPPSPPPSNRSRREMASSILPSFFGRRRPTSSASSKRGSDFAAAGPQPPGPGAFDFKSIMDSLDEDDAAQADLDAMAVICGRSRLSLANAHANHRGPVGELVGTGAPGQYATSTGQLETVREGHTPSREDERRLGSAGGSLTGDEHWQLAGSNEMEGDDREIARHAARGVSGVAYGSSTRAEEEGRARRHLMRMRDSSGEREQRRWRRNEQ